MSLPRPAGRAGFRVASAGRADGAAGERVAGELGVADDEVAVDQDVADAGGGAGARGVGGLVGDRRRVEDHDVGVGALGDAWLQVSGIASLATTAPGSAARSSRSRAASATRSPVSA